VIANSLSHAITPARGFALLLLAALFIHPLMAQQIKPALLSTVQVKKAAEVPFNATGITYKPGSRRDPFLNPLILKKIQKPEEDEELARGTPPPGIAGTYIAQAALQGISVRSEGRVAVVRGADTRAYFLKEGDRLFDGFLKKIDSDSITLVRETKMKSGKTLTQEVTKRLRTP
jgi:hypothetical protein